MGKLIDLTGQKFGRLLVIERGPIRNKRIYWKCKCDCGNEVEVAGQELRRGNTKSCGCLRKELVSEYKLIDLTNQVFGELTVLRRATKGEILNYTTVGEDDSHAYWWVQCNCGAEPFITSGRSLREGITKSCGHLRYDLGEQKIKNLVGKRFSRLEVINFVGVKDHYAIWHCKCDCGNECNARGTDLINEHTKSCGCLHKENLIQGYPKNLAGQQFGYLIPLYITDKRTPNGNAIWHCKCLACGNEKDIGAGNMVSGHTKSCGCIVSKGEAEIRRILNLNNIIYEEQKTFETCRSPLTNRYLRFDFYINNSHLIEYDGEQHFISENRGWNTKEHFIEIKYRDNIKNQWCKENNIPLIRIPYTHYKKLCLEDLLLETSQFIVS